MDRFNIPLTAERLAAYAIERQNSAERHQYPGSPSWMEQRRHWTDAILQGMTRLEGRDPAPELMDWYDRRLEAARGHAAIEPLPLKEQSALIRDLSRYVSALEAAGDDRRKQVITVRELLDDMLTYRPWTRSDNGLIKANEQIQKTILDMTARMPVRFTRISIGGGALTPRETGFLPGAVVDVDEVKTTALFRKMSGLYPEAKYWPVRCMVYVGGGLDSDRGMMDATDFDLNLIQDARDRLLIHPGIRRIRDVELDVSAYVDIRVLKVEPGKPPELVTMPNTLEAFQEAVGGYIEAVGLDANATLVCNEEGKLIGLPANRQVGGDIIAGTFLIVGAEDGEFCSLSDADAAHYAEQFAQPMPSCSKPEEPTQWEFYVL